MGPQLQYLETVLTCKGNYYAPDLHNHVDDLKNKLQQLIANDTSNLVLKKVEPWNSVRVTFNMPVEAARRLKELAERRDSILHDLGILAIQIEGDRVISLTLEGKSTDPPAEVVVSFPAQPVSNSSRVDVGVISDQERLDSRHFLAPPELVQAMTNLAAQDGLSSSSSEHVIPMFERDVEKLPAMVDGMSIPASRSAEYVSAQAAVLGKNSASSNEDASVIARHIAINQLSYELQSFQQQVEQQPIVNNDISCQASNGLTRLACSQTRSNPEEGRMIPISLGVLHPTQNALGRGWPPRMEDRMPISQNIASSSPLLVNLLKSPGGRHPQPNLMIPRVPPPPDLYLAGVTTMPQKRKRSQQRTPKRPKMEWDGKTMNEVENPAAFISIGPSSITQLGILQGTCAGESSVPYASGSASLPGLASSNTFPASTTSSLDTHGKHRFMINPYTGDLEEVEDADDANFSPWDGGKILTDASWPSGESATTSSMQSCPLASSKSSIFGFEAPVPQKSDITGHSQLSAESQTLFTGHQGNAKTNISKVLFQVVSMPDIPSTPGEMSKMSKTGDPGYPTTTSLCFNAQNCISSLTASSKTISPVMAYSSSYQLPPPPSEPAVLTSTSLHANSSVFRQVSLSPHTPTSLVQSKPLTTSTFAALYGNQTNANALSMSSASAQLSSYAITSSFHNFYSMTMHHNTSSILYPIWSPSLDAMPSVPSSSTLPAETKVVSTASALLMPCVPTTLVETSTEQNSNQHADNAGSVVTSRVHLPLQPAVCSSIFSKLPMISQGCLLQDCAGGNALNQNANMERVQVADVLKSLMSGTSFPDALCAQNLKTLVAPIMSATLPVGITDNSAYQTLNAAFATKTTEAGVKPDAKEGIVISKLGNGDGHNMKTSATFPFMSLPQELLSLSVAFSQNGRIPVMPGPTNGPGKPEKLDTSFVVGDGKVLMENLSKNCQNISTVSSEYAAKLVDLHNAQAVASEIKGVCSVGQASVQSADLVLPPDEAVDVCPEGTTVSSASRASSGASDVLSGSREITQPSSFPVVLAPNSIDSRTLQINRAAAVFQFHLQDAIQLEQESLSGKVTPLPGSFALPSFPCDMESLACKSANDIHPINVLGKGVLTAGSVFVTTPSAADQPNLQQQLVTRSLTSLHPSTDALKLSTKPPLGVNPLQPVFQEPFNNKHLTWEPKFMLPIGGLKGLPATEAVHSSGTPLTEVSSSSSSQPVKEKLGCASVAKPLISSASMPLYSLGQSESESSGDVEMRTLNVKYEGVRKTREGPNLCSDMAVPSGLSVDSNGTSASIGLQEIIAMQLPAIEQQVSKMSSCGPVNLPDQSGPAVTMPELKTAQELYEPAAVSDALRLPQPLPLSSFAGSAVKFAVFPEAKLLMTRETNHRKCNRSVDDSSPRSKATLTVAKLLEKAESAKMNMQPSNKASETISSMENSFRQSSGPSLLPFPESLVSIATLPGEMTMKLVATSPVATRTNFGSISSNCLSSKGSLNLSTGLSRSFSMMDANPLPITAPGYPLNLTESVQKVMQGVGLDTSPPPSPKPSTSSRLSPAKFGGMSISSVQTRSVVSHSCVASCSTTSENRTKDLVTSPAVTAGKITLMNPIPDTRQASVVPANSLTSHDRSDGDPGQFNTDETLLPSDTSQVVTEASLPVSAAGNGLTQMNSVTKTVTIPLDENGDISAKAHGAASAVDASMFCAVDHSYSALPDPCVKKSKDKSKDRFHDSFEDLPEHLSPVEDCHNAEVLFDEITETLVNHFEDKDLFVEDIIYPEGIETFDRVPVFMESVNNREGEVTGEPDIDELHDFENLNMVEETFVVEETGKQAEDGITHVQEMVCDVLMTELIQPEATDEVSSDLLDIITDDCESTTLVKEKIPSQDQNKITKEKPDILQSGNVTEPLPLTMDEVPAENITMPSSLNSESGEVNNERSQCHIADCKSISSSCDSLEKQLKDKIPMRRTRNRKSTRNRDKRGGRFARVGTADSKQELSDGTDRISVINHFACKSTDEAVDSDLVVAVACNDPCLGTESLKAMPSFGRMTTRSRGRRNPRAGENTVVPMDDSSRTGGWNAVPQQRELSRVASKLCENSQRLENPSFLRRSMRTLRKVETIRSNEINNCSDDTKVTTTRSRKRPSKDIVRAIRSRPARGCDRSAMIEITEEFKETLDSSLTPCTGDANQGTIPMHEEDVASRDCKEPSAKKSKT